MKLRNMFLCDAASYGSDNTFSVLRGGINSVNISFQQNPGIPQPVSLPPSNLALVATIDLDITEMGRLHNLEVALLDADGQRVLPELRAHFQSPTSQKKGQHNIILNMSIGFKKPGDYGFYLNVDGTELGYHQLHVAFVELKKA